MSKGNKNSNFPANKVNELDGQSYIGSSLHDLVQLRDMGIPKTDFELTDRITQYFNFCIETNRRPGIEGLSLALGTSRQNFWKWCNGDGSKSQEWRNQCLKARQTILAFIECVTMDGRLNPATSIFILKNWGGYQDCSNITIEQNQNDYKAAAELPTLPFLKNAPESDTLPNIYDGM